MLNNVENRAHLTLTESDINKQYELIEEVLRLYAMFDNEKHFSWPVLPLLRACIRGIRFSSPQESRKYQALLSQFGQMDKESSGGLPSPVTHIENDFDEDDENNKKIIAENSHEVERDVAIFKAHVQIKTEENVARFNAIRKYEEEHFERKGLEVNTFGDFLISASNDVMQGFITPDGTRDYQFKFNVQKLGINPKDTYQVGQQETQIRMREALVKQLQATVGERSTNQQNGEIRAVLSSATAIYEVHHDIGVVKKNDAEMVYKAASDDELNAVVFGLFNPDHPVSQEVQWKFLSMYDGQTNFWSPEVGLTTKSMLGINGGGWKLDHPLMLHVFGKSINGVPIDFTSQKFQKELARAHEIAMGVPREFSHLLLELTWKILDEELPEKYSQLGKRDHIPAGESSQLMQTLDGFHKQGISIGGRWTDLTDHSPEVITVDERAESTLGVFAAVRGFLLALSDRQNKAA